MSQETWTKEFMPGNPQNVPRSRAIQWCLKKFTGLLPPNLKRHNLKWVSGLAVFGIRNCPLCHYYLNHDTGCSTCPLRRHSPYKSPCYAFASLYSMAVIGNPKPIIAALQRALKAQIKRTKSKCKTPR